MSEYEYNFLISECSNFANVLFEFWLASTFAALVTAYLASGEIRKIYFNIMIFLYLMFSGILCLSYINQINKISYYIDRMQLNGFDYSQYMDPYGLIATAGVAVIYLFGLIFTVLFVSHSQSSKTRGNPSENKSKQDATIEVAC